MNFQSIYLTKKELRRFLEIANGDTTAKNTPDEDALFRNGLITETMLVFVNIENKTSDIDMRAVIPTDDGKEYFAWYKNEREKKQKDTWHFWLGISISVAGIVISVLLAMH